MNSLQKKVFYFIYIHIYLMEKILKKDMTNCLSVQMIITNNQKNKKNNFKDHSKNSIEEIFDKSHVSEYSDR